ncbi:MULTISPECIES: hypothetical protein [Paenibacillus]|uniref:RES domain-containing protein n=1 Tax=Paenibacillus vandeheii TaxID=3035917 RepID=A0ABT8JFZ9_9BACL|nr:MULTISPECIES: hypothetical protein [Paenibacillus]KGP77806.1 hypothetical protein P364_0131610 [Paenibacillus sp. MAEPY2]KGP77929.1 hypothetical protein P363_0132825 [Paenibacillus sp. MAEPY1]MDN4603960.1 hypothetical protein [Paenibacillus vandeheii]
MSNTLDLTECVICSSCAADIFEFFEKMGHPIAPYERFVKDHIVPEDPEEETEAVHCDVCNEVLESGKEYHTVNVPHSMVISIADYLSEDIGGCERCHGNERRGFEYAFNKGEPEDSHIDLGGSAHTAGSFIDWHGVPEVLIPVFVQLIRCNCGYGREHEDGNNPGGGIFKEEDDIYTYSEVDYTFGFGEFETKEFLEFAERYGEKISDEDLYSFKEILRTKPLLAYKDATGVAIYNVLKSHFDNENHAVLQSNEVKLYRGRTRPRDSGKQFEVEDMWAAPLGKTSHGRYNFIGVSVLYVTDQERAIPLELNPTHDQLIDVVTFDICKKRLKLFDLGSFDPTFQGFFNEVNEENNTVKSAYLLPNYIGACCSDIGYDGIKYLGVHQSEEGVEYVNYALFDIKRGLDLVAEKEVKTYKPKISIALELQEIKKPAEPLSPESVF